MTPTIIPNVRLYTMPVRHRCEHKGCQRRPRHVLVLVQGAPHRLQMLYLCSGHVDEHKKRIKAELERLGYKNPKDAK